MILITAATGQVGSAALNALAGADSEVRALVRNPSVFAAPEGVQVVQGDFDDDMSIASALKGVTVMLLAGRDSPNSVSQHRRILAQVQQSGVHHVVKLSAIGASPKSPVALMREHYEVDEEVRKGPAVWTFLKPHLYMQNLLRAADTIRREGMLAAPMGDNRPPLIDTRDIGAVAATVLRNPAAHVGREYTLTGPVAVSYKEVAKALTAVAGRVVTYDPVAPEEYENRLRAVGMPDWRAYDLAHIASAYGVSENAVSPDIATLLGRQPRSLSEFLEDHRKVYSG
ncbi:SDR family oxidoreductase [Mesorhizobium neociceri]|uniref:SDR family oxidoreductase n=1 Tax=Mesorhizobium neociceri TaxID=1307853 RepID=A0A838B707_9HYPH|nr:SDR family oxidoreductase [Mesorhizobium neociceri]MBA1142568.1 SDR family oxidoreductase [Mesorhizobium neociceri]